MPTPAKPANVIQMEKKAHYTKKDLSQRQEAENAQLTGIPIIENANVKSNKAAHKHFKEVTEMLALIGRDDNVYGVSINRYCLMLAEEDALQADIKRIRGMMDDPELDTDQLIKLQNQLLKSEGQLNTKQKMLLDLEKESLLTVASALRSVPKKAESKLSPLMEALAGDG